MRKAGMIICLALIRTPGKVVQGRSNCRYLAMVSLGASVLVSEYVRGLVVHGLGQGDDQEGQGAEVHGPGDPEDPAPAEELCNGPTEQGGEVGARGQHDGE